MDQILRYLKKHGDRLDSEIAADAGLSLSKTRLYLSELAAQGRVVTYHSTRFVEGQKIEGLRYRLTGIAPKAAPGRKAKGSIVN